MQTEPMTMHTKAVLMNLAILTGLIIQYLRGKPLLIVALSGVFILVIANLIMMAVAKKQSTTRS
ncbi:hypothetical protein [Granulicella arctica]|uniref:hypothetical protein n=1 Tax=Granulicella arctica TaxID=940613 RepID=UPI0021E0CBAD|nr:hypothetical protein [Granulicella arctica]